MASEVASLLEADFSVVGRYEPDETLTHLAGFPSTLLSRSARA